MPIEMKELEAAVKEEGEVRTFVQGLVSEAVTEATKGLKTTNESLKEEKTKLQGILDKMPSAEELEGFKKMQQTLETSEDAKLIAEGKIDEVIARRTDRVVAEATSQVESLTEENGKLKTQLGDIVVTFDNHRIDENVRAEALKQGVAPEALQDVTLRAQGLFSIDDDGKIVSRDSEGNIRTNKAGTPIDISVFVADLKESAPHFWPGSTGAGLSGNLGEGGGDALIIAAEKGNTTAYIEGRRAARKKAREAHLS